MNRGSTTRGCEHHWVSTHQPDFPDAIYWLRICSLCGAADGADLRRQLFEATAALRARASVATPARRLVEAWDSLMAAAPCDTCRNLGAHLIRQEGVDAINDAIEAFRGALDLPGVAD